MDEVIIGAPFSVTKDVLEKVYKINCVVHGATEVDSDVNSVDPYEVPILFFTYCNSCVRIFFFSFFFSS